MAMTTRIPPQLAAARHYTQQGWPVFILGRTKRPVANCPACPKGDPGHDRQACPHLTCHGFYAATTDPDRVAAMLDAVPRGLLAIRTGTMAGLVVIDIDPAHGGQHDPHLMTPTACVATGGGGWHLYYHHPGGTVASRPMPGHPGVDIKADGGYVIAPPSVHPHTGRPYRWAGTRPVDEMPPPLRTVASSSAAATPAAPQAAPAPPRPATGTRGGGISSPTALLQSCLAAIDQAPQGRRRVTVYGAARGVARMVAAGAIDPHTAWNALYTAGRRASQSDRDTRAAITGGFRAEHVCPPMEGHPA